MASHTRICLTGPECTGKSSLAKRLAAELGAPLVEEYARTYAERVTRPLTAGDIEPIARGQMAAEDAVQAALVILDTDLLSTVVYARHYYGDCPSWIAKAAYERRAGLYLLMDTDVCWIDDPVRDRDPESREDLFDAFRRTLEDFDCRWRIVSGEGEARWEAIQDALA
jgi:NadR type nicotinamide-nucleotide adenylyltransferase